MSLTTQSTFEVHQEPITTGYREALALLNATRQHVIDERRFEWLYRQNPDGEAVLWSVRDAKTGEMAGFTVALPRRVVVDGEIKVCWNCADFSMHPKYRTLGPAIKLRRAAKDGVDAGQVEFLYAHPNARMAKIHDRVGHRPVGRMVRYSFVLKSASYLEARIGPQWLAKAIGGVIDPCLRMAGRASRHRAATETRLISPARFDERFDRLFASAVTSARVIGVRDSAYLTWRYADNPLYESHVLVAENDDDLRGYLVYTVQENTANIKDIFPPHDVTAVRDLIAAMIGKGRELGLQSLSFTCLEGNSVTALFREFGFRPRPDTSQMYAYAPGNSGLSTIVNDPGSWFLIVGDRDV